MPIRFPSGSLSQAARPAPTSAIPSTVFGVSYSSNGPPFAPERGDLALDVVDPEGHLGVAARTTGRRSARPRRTCRRRRRSRWSTGSRAGRRSPGRPRRTAGARRRPASGSWHRRGDPRAFAASSSIGTTPVRYAGHDGRTPARSKPGRTPATLLATPYRTHTCGALRAADAGITARLSGWVHRRRDHGQLIFLDLRDRHGITQVVIDKADDPEAHATASRVRGEFVVTRRGRGRAAPRRDGEPAPADRRDRAPRRDVRILSESKTPPFYINEPGRDDRRVAPAALPLPRHPARGDGRAGCCSAAASSRRSARSTTPTASSRSRRRT